MNALTKQFTDAVEAQFTKLDADVQDALLQAKTAQAIITTLEQKMSRPMGSDGPSLEEKSWGAQFIERGAEELKTFAENGQRPGRLRIELKGPIAARGEGLRESAHSDPVAVGVDVAETGEQSFDRAGVVELLDLERGSREVH